MNRNKPNYFVKNKPNYENIESAKYCPNVIFRFGHVLEVKNSHICRKAKLDNKINEPKQ